MTERERAPWGQLLAVGGVLVAAQIAWFGWSAAHPAPKTAAEMERSAVAACQVQVRAQLVSPSTAAFSDGGAYQLPAGGWRAAGHVDAQNGFGATLRAVWSCDVTPAGVATVTAVG